jgi:hypothetical protein
MFKPNLDRNMLHLDSSTGEAGVNQLHLYGAQQVLMILVGLIEHCSTAGYVDQILPGRQLRLQKRLNLKRGSDWPRP